MRKSAAGVLSAKLWLALLILLGSAQAHAVEQVGSHVAVPAAPRATERVPRYRASVNDTANLLSRSAIERISATLDAYQSETHHQFAVLTVPTLAGEKIDSFSLRVANTWALGDQGLDNGVLVTIALKERGVRVDIGKGLERYIPDSMVQSIINESINPAFAKGDFAGGLEAGLARLMQAGRSYKVAGVPAGTQR